MIKVLKFGGSSVASPKQFKKVKSIIESDAGRKIIITSACGKDNHEDYKVTDLLYLCHAHLKYGVPCDDLFSLIVNKYTNIKNELGLKLNLDNEINQIKVMMDKNVNLDYLVSRGEYLAAKLLAEYLGAEFIDAKDVIKFKYNGEIDFEESKRLLNARMSDKKIVIPGFYGSLPNMMIKVMDRGGSDITGSIVANLINAEVYENWSDVSGILMADPKVVKNPRRINYITYDELRELSYMGANVLHDEAIFPVKAKSIPINIRNTNDKDNPGTLIVKDCSLYDEKNPPGFITGISGKKDFSIITCNKTSVSYKVGTLLKALSIFAEYNISIESVPAGVDTFSIIVESFRVEKNLYEIIARLKEELKLDKISVLEKVSLIVVVGRGMKNKPGMSGKLFAELGLNDINIRIINQAADEIDIIIGVDNKDFEKTINCIYDKFIEGEKS